MSDREELVGVLQVLEPHTLHAGTHEGKASFLIIYILIHIQRKSFVFWFYQRRSFGGKYGGKYGGKFTIKSNLYYDISISG